MRAEWQKQQALLVSYPHERSDWFPYLEEAQAFYDHFISIVARYQKVIVITSQELKFPPSKYPIHIVKLPTNDTWIRDYGPITIHTKKGLKLLDFIFNGWGLKYPANLDNQINRRLFGTKKLGFVLEGGSIESNAQGVILTTSNCLLEANRNPHLNKAQIETYLKKILHAHTILWLDYGYLEGDDTDGHIDMLARFINPTTIAYIGCDDPKDPHYEELRKMKEQLKSFGYDLVQLPWVDPIYYQGQRLAASYANFVIINNALLVPQYGDPKDKEALNILGRCFANREIIGIDARILIRQGGSLHCSCMNLYEE